MADGTELRQPDIFQTYALYLAAGLAAIPAALGYAILSKYGLAKPGVVIPVLAVGLLLAHVGWQFTERRLLHIPKSSIPLPASQPEAGPLGRDFMTASVAIVSWIGVLLIGFFLVRLLVPPNPIQM